MKALQKMAALGAVVAACSVLFVVVCPATPTPVAVVRGPDKVPTVTAAVFAVLVALATTLLPQHGVVPFSGGITPAAAAPHTLLDLTCVRRC